MRRPERIRRLSIICDLLRSTASPERETEALASIYRSVCIAPRIASNLGNRLPRAAEQMTNLLADF